MAEEGLNEVTLIGRLGQDPELRFTQSNQGVLTIRMATTETYLDNNTKERKERTEWHTVTVWSKRGEGLSKILSKGSRICVKGRLQTRSWDDKQGNKRYSTDIVATNVILLGDGKGRDRQDGDHGSARGGNGGGGYEEAPPPDDNSGGATDDIPFASSTLTNFAEGIGEAWNNANKRLI
jgi:single-strand DNA-binding protein